MQRFAWRESIAMLKKRRYKGEIQTHERLLCVGGFTSCKNTNTFIRMAKAAGEDYTRHSHTDIPTLVGSCKEVLHSYNATYKWICNPENQIIKQLVDHLKNVHDTQ